MFKILISSLLNYTTPVNVTYDRPPNFQVIKFPAHLKLREITKHPVKPQHKMLNLPVKLPYNRLSTSIWLFTVQWSQKAAKPQNQTFSKPAEICYEPVEPHSASFENDEAEFQSFHVSHKAEQNATSHRTLSLECSSPCFHSNHQHNNIIICQTEVKKMNSDKKKTN